MIEHIVVSDCEVIRTASKDDCKEYMRKIIKVFPKHSEMRLYQRVR